MNLSNIHIRHKKPKESISLFYKQYGGVVYGLLCRVIEDHKTIETILVRTFQYAWKHHHKMPTNDSKILFWLLKIVRLHLKGNVKYKLQPSNSDKTAFLSQKQQYLMDWFFLQYCSKDEIAAKLNIPIERFQIELRVISLIIRKQYSHSFNATTSSNV